MTQANAIYGGSSLKLGEKFNLLEPSLVYKVWGGKQMSQLKGITPTSESGELLGETWEISVHPDGPSSIAKQSLAEIVNQEQMPYLVKLIDTSDHLSVQVHPDDEFAKTHENSLGKTECWIILGAEEGAGIYLGMKPGVDKKEFESALSAGSAMDEFLVFHEVKRGDFFYVPAGSIHAIGSGVFLAEVQQSSGITYRVWDWNRLDANGKSRELHVDKAMQVIRFGDDFNCENTFKKKENIFKNGESKIIEHPQFKLRQVTLNAGEKIELHLVDENRVKGILNLGGKIRISDIEFSEYQAAVMSENKNKEITVEAIEAGSFLLVE